jgi:hypothetical protein
MMAEISGALAPASRSARAQSPPIERDEQPGAIAGPRLKHRLW